MAVFCTVDEVVAAVFAAAEEREIFHVKGWVEKGKQGVWCPTRDFDSIDGYLSDSFLIPQCPPLPSIKLTFGKDLARSTVWRSPKVFIIALIPTESSNRGI